jgi:uncharacterized membrane protein
MPPGAPLDPPVPAPGAPGAPAALRGRALLTVTRASFVLVASAPWVLPIARRFLPLGVLGWLADLAFVVLCHRLPERTLTLWGEPMPVCSRCAGIFAGLGMGALLARPRLTVRAARVAVAGAGALILVDVLTQDLGVRPFWHPARLVTGALLGYVLSCTLVSAILREQRLSP